MASERMRQAPCGLKARQDGRRSADGRHEAFMWATASATGGRRRAQACGTGEHVQAPRGRWRLAVAATATVASLMSGSDAVQAYGLQNGRLEKCRGDIPCVSTSSVGNPSKFGPPWSYQPETSDADTAWASLKRVVAANRDRGTIVECLDGPDVYYLRAEFASAVRGIDDVEFRLIKSDSLVTYRSASREAIFVYPLQTPINTDKNKTRLLDIRNSLGWEEFAGFNVFGLEDSK